LLTGVNEIYDGWPFLHVTNMNVMVKLFGVSFHFLHECANVRVLRQRRRLGFWRLMVALILWKVGFRLDFWWGGIFTVRFRSDEQQEGWIKEVWPTRLQPWWWTAFPCLLVVSVSIDYGKRLLTRGFNPDCFLF
jgi:hypothetical protein